MKRKVVLHGPATLTVSLPSSWVKRHKIRKGSELFLDTYDEKLIIRPQKNTERESINLKVDGLDRTSAKLFIRSAYRKGFDNIKLIYKKQEFEHIRSNTKTNIMEIVKNESNQLVGFELINIQDNKMELAHLTSDKTEEFSRVLRKSFHCLIDFAVMIGCAIRNGKVISPEFLEEKHNITEKFNNYCLRLLNRKVITPPAL